MMLFAPPLDSEQRALPIIDGYRAFARVCGDGDIELIE
jgi:hypothetical protein